jgi:hypothetical protein
LEQEGLIAARAISKWRVEPNAAMLAPPKKEIVITKSHIDRGLSLPPSYFIKSMLRHYRLQLHHIAPNSLTIIAGFVTLCKGYQGVYPHRDLFRLYFNIRHNGNQMEIFATADLSHLFLIAENHIPTSSHMILLKDGGEPSSTRLTKHLSKISMD